MNSLKGLGAVALLAGIAVTVSQLARVDEIVLAATLLIVTTSTVTYVASRKRLRRDRRIADGRHVTSAEPLQLVSRRTPASRPRPVHRRRGRSAFALALAVVVLGAAGSLYLGWHPGPSQPAGGAAAAIPLTVRYRTDTPSTAPAGKPWLEVINTSASPVALGEVKVRYYFTADEATAYAANCLQTSLRCSSITAEIGVPTSPTPGASRYLEIGFTPDAGTLAPGQTTQGIGLQLYRLDQRAVDQTDDHSFDATITHYAPSRLVTAYVDGLLSWGDEPGSERPSAPRTNPVVPTPAVTAPPVGVVFDNFHYTGPDDPVLAANGWQARTGAGGPGMTRGTWSAGAISFPGDPTAQGGQALQLQVSTDGTAEGTHQAELVTSRSPILTGTLAARIFFADEPADGRDGDHINESFCTISSSAASPKYSELDYEYMPNGGWGAPGPRLDTTSWRSARPGDRVTHALNEHLAGWHVVMLTAVNGVVTYSIDGRKVFSSDGKSFPRERMRIHFSTWLVDLPFGGQRNWDMRVNWLYYQANQALSVSEIQHAVDGLYASGINYADTVSY